jgi:hypothetical protein
MGDLATAVSRLTGRTVVDKTGITEIFSVLLTFVPAESMMQLPGPPGGAGNQRRPTSHGLSPDSPVNSYYR